jgi:hypothetical protein
MCRKGKKFGRLVSVQRPSMLYIGRTYTWTMCAGKERKRIGWSLRRRSAKRTIDVAIVHTYIYVKERIEIWLADVLRAIRRGWEKNTVILLRLVNLNKDCKSIRLRSSILASFVQVPKCHPSTSLSTSARQPNRLVSIGDRLWKNEVFLSCHCRCFSLLRNYHPRADTDRSFYSQNQFVAWHLDQRSSFQGKRHLFIDLRDRLASILTSLS